MTLGGSVAVVTTALVVAGGASCLSLLNDNLSARAPMDEGQSVAYKTQSASETKSNRWETAETAYAALAGSSLGHASGGKYRVASAQFDRVSDGGAKAEGRGAFPLYRLTDDGSVVNARFEDKPVVTYASRRLQGEKLAYANEGNSNVDKNRLENTLRSRPINPQSGPVKESLTKLVDFDSAPFPFEGRSYRDNRVLLHIPKGFDPRRPAVMVLFFHGHRATLERDVRDRQQVPAQISASGMNAVLVAPQFAFDAPDSSVGRFSQPGAVARFVNEAAEKLAQLDGDPLTAKVFANMQIVIFGYSGGFMPTAYSLYSGGFPKNRVRGVVLLDGVYGQLDKFATWIENNRSGFFISSYTHYTKQHNRDLEHILAEHDVTVSHEIKPDLGKGGVAFVEADVPHRDYVTHAWVDYPIKDVISRLADYQLPTRPSTVAQYDPAGRR
jgi:hypothetical protein